MSLSPHEPMRDLGVLADRVDGEPPAILGLTTSELLLVSVATGLVLLPLLLVLALAIDAASILLSLTGFIFMAGVVLGATVLRRLKRGHPVGHYQVKFAVLMQRLFGGRRFMLRSGHWSLGRTRQPGPGTGA
jgi:conjugative transfer region protein (TIGR03750 family)